MSIIYESGKKILPLIKGEVDFTRKNVLDIGCGDGVLTFSLANLTQLTVGIDPCLEDIALAQKNTPAALADRVRFVAKPIAGYQPESGTPLFDIGLFLWSL